MTLRTWLALALAICIGGCAAETPTMSRMHDSLDEYVLERPIDEAWTAALRFLNERGYPPVGADRARIGLAGMGSWSTAASKGVETQVSDNRWIAETQMDQRGRRYRIIGVILSPTTCRIGFFAVNRQNMVSPTDEPSRENTWRDAPLELEFVQTIDPQGAAKMRPKNPGFF